MADYSETISLSDYKVGDRWIGVASIGAVTVNSATPTPDLTRIVMTFRLGQLVYTLDSDEGEITISDANTWEASIAARDEFLPKAGKWEWTMSFWQTNLTSPWVLYKGTLVVHPNIS